MEYFIYEGRQWGLSVGTRSRSPGDKAALLHVDPGDFGIQCGLWHTHGSMEGNVIVHNGSHTHTSTSAHADAERHAGTHIHGDTRIHEYTLIRTNIHP